jgi:hypothetical protein
MAKETKTKQTDENVKAFLNTIEDEKKRKDSFAILEIMKKVSGSEPKMWGTSIIGFGSYHYKYDSGHEGDMCLVGFSPRKQNITFYLMMGLYDSSKLLSKLGKHKTGKGCLYINRMEDINTDVLKEIIKTSVNEMKKKYKK